MQQPTPTSNTPAKAAKLPGWRRRVLRRALATFGGLVVAFIALVCFISNEPACHLEEGVVPFPPAHEIPPQHVWHGPHVSLPYSMHAPQSSTPKGVVIIIGGWDTVTTDYQSLARALAAYGYASYGCENRSFKYGPADERGDCKDWRLWVEDLLAFSEFVRNQHSGISLYWYGQSFGAVQALAALSEARGPAVPAGLIIESPAYSAMLKKPKPALEATLGIFGWYRFPHFRIMDWQKLTVTEDPKWDCAWLHSEDRVSEGYKVRFLIQFAEMGLRARQNAADIGPPVLAIWGGRDRLVIGGDETRRNAFHRFMSEELAQGKAAHLYFPEGGHILTESTTQSQAINGIAHWLDSLTR